MTIILTKSDYKENKNMVLNELKHPCKIKIQALTHLQQNSH